MATAKQYELLFMLKAQMASGFGNAFQQAGGKLGELQEKVSTFNQKLQDIDAYQKMEAEIQSLTEQFDGEKSRLVDVEDALSRTEQGTRELISAKEREEAEITRLAQEQATETSELKQYNSVIKEVEAKIKSLSGQKEKLELKITSLNAQIQRERDEIARLQQAMTKEGADTKSLTAEINKHEQSIQKLENQLAGETAKLQAVNEKLKQQRSDLKQLSSEKSQLESRIKTLNTQMAEEKAKLQQVEEELKQNRGNTDELLAKKAQLEQRITTLGAKIREEKGSLQELGEKLKQAGINTKNLEEETEKLTEEWKKSKEEQQKFQEQMDELDTVADQLLAVKMAADAVNNSLGKMVDFVAECIESAGDLEYTMSAVAAVSGATEAEEAQLTALVKELGATTRYTAAECAEALQTEALAGWSVENMLSGLPAVIKMAAAADEDLADMTSIVSDALNAFGLSGEEAVTEFADTLAKAATSSNTTVGLLGESLTYVETTAGNLGYTIQDVSAALAAMAQNSLKGSMSGSALNTILTRMSGANSAAAAEMEKLGLSMYNADGSAKDLLTFLNELRAAFQNFGDDSQAAQVAAYKLAGMRGMKGLLAIVNQSDESWQALVDDIYDYEGASEEISSIRMDNYNGQLLLLKSAWEALENSIGEVFLPTATKAASVLTDITTALNGFVQEHENAVMGMAAGAGTALALAAGISTVATAVNGLRYAVQLLTKTKEGAAIWTKYISTLGTGLGVSAVVGLTVALGSYIYTASKGSEASQELVSQLEQLEDANTETNQSYKESLSVYEDNRTEAESLIQKLASLEERTVNTGDAVNTFSSATLDAATSGSKLATADDLIADRVSRLNALLPGLNAKYDTLSGTLNLTTDEMNAFNDAMSSEERELRENYVEELTGQLADYQEQLDSTNEELETLLSNNYLLQLYYDAIQRGDLEAASRLGYGISIGTFASYENLIAAQKEAQGLIDDTNEKIEEQKELLQAKSRAEMDAYGITGMTVDQYDELIEQVDELGSTYQSTYDTAYETIMGQFDLTEKLGDYLGSLGQSYQDAFDEAQKSFQELYTMMDKVESSDITSVSLSTLSSNLSSQETYWANYSTYLNGIKDSGYDIGNMWDEISDGSNDAYVMAQALYNAIQSGDTSKLDELVQQYKNIEESQKEAAEAAAEQSRLTIADMQEAAQSQVDALASYYEGLDALANCDVDLSGIWDSLTDGSEESMDMVQALYESIKGGDTTELETYVATINEKADMAGKSAEVIAETNDTVLAEVEALLQNIEELAGGDEELYQNCLNAVTDALSGYTDGLTSSDQAAAAERAFEYWTDKLDTSFSLESSGEETGTSYIDGFVGSLEEDSTALAIIDDITTRWNDRFNSDLGVHSPSTITKESGENYIEGFLLGAEAKEQDVYSLMGQIASGATTSFGDKISRSTFYSFGSYSIEGAISGANSKKSKLITTYQNLANAASSAYAKTLDINSPSKVFYEFGGYTMEGDINGAWAMKEKVEETYGDLATAAYKAYTEPESVGTFYTRTVEPLNESVGSRYVTSTTDSSKVIQLTYAPVIQNASESSQSIKEQLEAHDEELTEKIRQVLVQVQRDERRRAY